MQKNMLRVLLINSICMCAVADGRPLRIAAEGNPDLFKSTYEIMEHCGNFGSLIARNTMELIEDKMLGLFEEYYLNDMRKFFLQPQMIEKVAFTYLSHKVVLEKVLVQNTSNCLVTEKELHLGMKQVLISLTLSFPHVRVEGNYSVNSHYSGTFWINVRNAELKIEAIANHRESRVKYVYLEPSIEYVENNYESSNSIINFRVFKSLINFILAKTGPQMVEEIWPQVEPSFREAFLELLNSYIYGN